MTPDNTILEFMFAGLTVVGLFLLTAVGVLAAMWLANSLSEKMMRQDIQHAKELIGTESGRWDSKKAQKP